MHLQSILASFLLPKPLYRVSRAYHTTKSLKPTKYRIPQAPSIRIMQKLTIVCHVILLTLTKMSGDRALWGLHTLKSLQATSLIFVSQWGVCEILWPQFPMSAGACFPFEFEEYVAGQFSGVCWRQWWYDCFLIDFQFFGAIVECHSSVVVISRLASNAIGYLS